MSDTQQLPQFLSTSVQSWWLLSRQISLGWLRWPAYGPCGDLSTMRNFNSGALAKAFRWNLSAYRFPTGFCWSLVSTPIPKKHLSKESAKSDVGDKFQRPRAFKVWRKTQRIGTMLEGTTFLFKSIRWEATTGPQLPCLLGNPRSLKSFIPKNTYDAWNINISSK